MVTLTNLEQFKECFKILNDDFTASIEYEKSNNSDYAKRALIRTLFALIEGILYHLRQLTLEQCTEPQIFDQDVIDLLREEKFEPADINREKPKQNFQALKQSIEFVFNKYALSRATKFKLNKSDSRWKLFCDAIAIRHRVTHPKHPISLTIAPSEIDVICQAEKFFEEELTRLLLECEKVSQSF